ncbi:MULTISPECIES: hypothetical protein [unclassified Streptomyces]|uniref:hypothetical protein n=1 Tax=unclassified Streptomyces TaxID=2593676 RepID=UPI000689CC64|nr:MULTISPECIES: hypothetical protein [unclassified Streptomyces]
MLLPVDLGVRGREPLDGRTGVERDVDGTGPACAEADGRAAVDQWLDRAASEHTCTTELLTARKDAADRCTVTRRLRGDFPGGTVDLHFRFTLDGDLISGLTIAP